MTEILDACCGGKMFWYNKENPNVTFMDNRRGEYSLGTYQVGEVKKNRKLVVNPDIVADFRNIPFPDAMFYMVVFDPPHLIYAGKSSWLAKKYGVLNANSWAKDLKQGFNECMRVLKPHGTLIFKWNTDQIPIARVLQQFEQQPLFGDRRSKTRWLVFMKE